MKCEEQLMEKELLLDQVTRLSQPIRDQLENGQQERLQMAKKARDTKDKVTPAYSTLYKAYNGLNMLRVKWFDTYFP